MPGGDIMSAMDISSHLDFAAQPTDVYAMMTDQKYLEEVCVASGSLSYHVSVEGSTTKTSRTLPAPDSAARFTGPKLTVNEEVVWGDPSSDGSRSGAVTMTVLGQPVTFRGKPAARGRRSGKCRGHHRRAEGRDPAAGKEARGVRGTGGDGGIRDAARGRRSLARELILLGCGRRRLATPLGPQFHSALAGAASADAACPERPSRPLQIKYEGPPATQAMWG